MFTSYSHSIFSSNEFSQSQDKKVDFAIFAAMSDELDFFYKFFYENNIHPVITKTSHFEFKIYTYHQKKILLSEIGLGSVFAASLLTLINQQFSPKHIFLTGTAGGIHSQLNLRDVIIVENAFEAEIQGVFSELKDTPFESCLTHPLNKKKFPASYAADPQLLNLVSQINFPNVKTYQGTVVSSNTFPAPKALFGEIKDRNAYSIDMETSAFYQVAWLLKLSVLAVRGISNLLNHEGTDDNVNASDVYGSAKSAALVVLKIIDTLIFQPSLLEKIQTTALLPNDTSAEMQKIINRFELQPHPEGGFYARHFQSKQNIISTDADRYQGESRFAGTSIYYLLCNDNFSAWHKIKSDEIWHFYEGSSLNIHVINKQGELKTYILGNTIKEKDAAFQVIVEAGNWFAAELRNKNTYGFVGCTVSPGFDFKDFELAKADTLQIYSKTIDKNFIQKFLREPKSTLEPSSANHSRSQTTVKI